MPVIAVGSHDTASAVAAVPAEGRGFAYISSGTWSLVGCGTGSAPVLTEASRAANFSNEAGVDGTIRYLRNVMGLWLLQESARSWAQAGPPVDLAALLGAAARRPALATVIDPDDPVFLPPGDMPARIAAAARRPASRSRPSPPRPWPGASWTAWRWPTGGRSPGAGAVRAARRRGAHRRRRRPERRCCCQLTADACGLPVMAGPAEATALGNILVQARALGAAPGDLAGMRALLRATQPLRRFELAAGTAAAWAAAAARLGW